MARLVTSGFELNDSSVVSEATGKLHPDPAYNTAGLGTWSTANPRTGTYHGRCTYVGTSRYFELTLAQTTAVTYWFRTAMYLPNLPAGSAGSDRWTLLQLRTSAAAIAGVTVELGSDGILRYGTAASTGVVQANAYFVMEFKHKIDTGNAANNLVEILLNGASVYTNSGVAAGLGTTIADKWRVGVVSVTGSPGNVTVDIDDYAVNDDTGGSQNGSTGTGKIVLLKPISDNAGGSGWTLGTGTALGGNGFNAVDNTPPTGDADLAAGSDTKQIRNAAAAANSNMDVNLTTYTNAGIVAADTVNVVVPHTATAAPVVTSSKQGTIGVSSNPAITNIALSAGGVSGAFWSGTAGGVYPTGWKWSKGTITYAPSVTLGNSPVCRVTQVTSSTRIAVVCAMGMYVDYTRAATSLLPISTTVPTNRLM